MDKKTIIGSTTRLTNHSLYLWLGIFLLILVLLLPGCIKEEKPVFVIDYAHSEVFMPLDPRPLGYSELNNVFEDAGYEFKVVTEPLTEKDLSRARVYLLAGPMSELNEEERNTVRNFINRGGKVIVLVHISSPLNEFLEEYDINIGWVLAEQKNTLERPHDFVIENIGEGEIFEDIGSLSFYGAFSVQAPETYAITSANAWEDFNMNGVKDEGEPQGSFALIGMVKYGRGYILTIGDDAVLANRFIGEEDNLKLARNLAKWGLR